MKTLKKVEVQIEKVYFMPEQEDMEEGVVYFSEQFDASSHLCLCGCKNQVYMPLNRISIDGKEKLSKKSYGWNLEIKNSRATFTPSVGNYCFPCNSHYIITKSIANFV